MNRGRILSLILLTVVVINLLPLFTPTTHASVTPVPSPSYVTVYESEVTSSSFVLNTSLPQFSLSGLNFRVFKYANLTEQLQTFVGQQWTPTGGGLGSVIESTAWKVRPYYYNGELVVNSTGASIGGQFIAWQFIPSTTTINVTIHVTSFPKQSANPGIVIYPPSAYNASYDNELPWDLLVDFYGGDVWVQTPTHGYYILASGIPQPNPNYPFTFTVILTENSAGNVTIAEIGINGTYYQENINTPYPWGEIGYVGIRGDVGNLFYVSYFSVTDGVTVMMTVPTYAVYQTAYPESNLLSITASSPVYVSPYYDFNFSGGYLQAGSVIESTGWSPSPRPYYQNGELVFNDTDVSSGGQYIAWRFIPSTTMINETIHVTSFPKVGASPAVGIFPLSSYNATNDLDYLPWALYLDINGHGHVWVQTAPGHVYILASGIPQPNPNYPFTFSIIFTENSAGNVTIAEVGINGTYYQVNINTPIPWDQIGYVGIRGYSGNLFYVSYFAVISGSTKLVLVPSSTISAEPLTRYQLPPTTGKVSIYLGEENGHATLLAIRSENGTYFYNLNLNTPWEPIGFLSSSITLSQYLTVVSIPSTPAYLAVFPANLTFSPWLGESATFSVPSTVFTPSFTTTTYPMIQGNAGDIIAWTPGGSLTVSGTANVFPEVGGYYVTSVSLPSTVTLLINGTPHTFTYGSTIKVSLNGYTTTIIYPANLIPNVGGSVQYNATYNKLVTKASSVTFTVYTSFVQDGDGAGFNLPPYIVLYSSTANIQFPVVVMPTLLSYRLVGLMPEIESTGWGSSPRPYYQNGELVFNVTNPATGGQFIAWQFIPTSTTINLTIHVTAYPIRSSGPSPSIGFYPPSSYNATDDFVLPWVVYVSFNGGNVWVQTPTHNGVYSVASGIPQPNPNYPFTFSVIFTENSAGNVTVAEIGINGTYYQENINTPVPWDEIGYVTLRTWEGDLFYVSYFAVTENGQTIYFISPQYPPFLQASSSYTVPVSLDTQFSYPFSFNSSEAIVGPYELQTGLNYLTIPGASGIVFTSILYYNSTVLANLYSPYVSVKTAPLSLSFSSPLEYFYGRPTLTPQIITFHGSPLQGNYIYQDPVLYPTLPSVSLTFYNVTSITSISSANATTTSSTTPSATTTSTTASSTTPSTTASNAPSSLSPGQVQIVYNGSAVISMNLAYDPEIYVPKVGAITALPIVNSSGAYLYLYYFNQSANFNVTVTYRFPNGTTISKNVPVNSIIPLPVSAQGYVVNISYGNVSTGFAVNPTFLTNAQLANRVYQAISGSLAGTPFAVVGSILAVLFFASFALVMFVRNDMRLMGMGGVSYAIVVAPGLLMLGFPTFIVVPSAIVAFALGVYALYQAR